MVSIPSIRDSCRPWRADKGQTDIKAESWPQRRSTYFEVISVDKPEGVPVYRLHLSQKDYENGYISTGSDRLGGQALWGVIAPLNARYNKYKACVEIVASFKNGTLNEHMVKTAQL